MTTCPTYTTHTHTHTHTHTGEPIDFSGEKNINNVANLLKAFLRELPEPLLTAAQLYDQWVSVCQLGDNADDVRHPPP
jgi:hypothetical protein